jgi:hypothetical protein
MNQEQIEKAAEKFAEDRWNDEGFKKMRELRHECKSTFLAGAAAVKAHYEKEFRNAIQLLTCVRECGEDGERLESCCKGEHLNMTLMRGDRIYRLSYSHASQFDALTEMEDGK